MFIHDKNCGTLGLITAALALLLFSGCASSHSPTAPAALKKALFNVGQDMKAVSKDLGPPKTTDATKLGPHEQTLGNDMSTLSYDLQAVGHYGNPPTPLAQDLGKLGNALVKPANDIANLGSDVKNKASASQLNTDTQNLQSDLGNAKNDVGAIAGDLNTGGVPADLPEFVSVKGDIKTWIAHIQTLNAHLAANPPDVDSFGPDLAALGSDFSSLSGLKRTIGTNVFGNPRIVGGYITLSPYTITTVTVTNANGTTGTAEKLQGSSTTGAATVQVDYAHRWSWDYRSIQNRPLQSVFDGTLNPFRFDSYDVQLRGGYTFTSSSNASTIIGSGNVDLELGGGLQLVRWANNYSAGNINLDLGVETESDRSFVSAHNTYFVGPAYVTSFVSPFTTNRVFMMFRMGSAFYDVPAFSGGYVATNGIGDPKYSLVNGLAMEFEAAYPLSPSSQLVANARVYPSHSIAPWTLWLGLSVSFDQLQTVGTDLGKMLGISSSGSPSAGAGNNPGGSGD